MPVHVISSSSRILLAMTLAPLHSISPGGSAEIASSRNGSQRPTLAKLEVRYQKCIIHDNAWKSHALHYEKWVIGPILFTNCVGSGRSRLSARLRKPIRDPVPSFGRDAAELDAAAMGQLIE